MPPRLHQINLTFDAVQDRLLLCLTSSDGAEFRFWLTRHYVRLLWPVLIRTAASFGSHRTTDAAARNALVEFDHEQAVAGSDYATPYETGRTFPLGEEPLLLAGVETRTGPEDTRVIILQPAAGQGMEITVDARLLHSLLKLFMEQVAKTEWDLALKLTEAPNEPVYRQIH